MIEKRTEKLCKKTKTPAPPFSYSEHVMFMQDCNRSMWKRFIAEIKNKPQ